MGYDHWDMEMSWHSRELGSKISELERLYPILAEKLMVWVVVDRTGAHTTLPTDEWDKAWEPLCDGVL